MPLPRSFLLFALLLSISNLILPCHADLPTLTVLHTFAPGGSGELTPSHEINLDGSRSEGLLVQGHDGAFYGTTTTGGAHGTGVIFKISADGSSFAVLHSFGPLGTLFVNDTNADGCYPMAALVCGKDGTLYGAATQGGPGGSGTVFKLSPDGSGFAVLHSFEAKEEMFHNSGGASPLGLTLGPDSALYGVAELGGSGRGLLFRLTTDGGNFRVLHSFDNVDPDGNVNEGGSIPSAAVVFGHDSLLYGTANIGGRSGCGVIFRMGPDGKHFTVLHNFQRKVSSNGVFPSGSLTLGTDSTLYGSARQGGGADGGILYKINANGTGFTILHTFSNPSTQSGDGWRPSGLVFGSEGMLYGVSAGAGENGGALLFKIRPEGAKFFLVHNFSPEEGSGNDTGLILGSDGNLYGVSTNGGANKTGTIFRVTLHPAK